MDYGLKVTQTSAKPKPDAYYNSKTLPPARFVETDLKGFLPKGCVHRRKR